MLLGRACCWRGLAGTALLLQLNGMDTGDGPAFESCLSWSTRPERSATALKSEYHAPMPRPAQLASRRLLRPRQQ